MNDQELNDQIKALDDEAARLVTIESNLSEHPLARKDVAESASRIVTVANNLRAIRDARTGNAIAF